MPGISGVLVALREGFEVSASALLDPSRRVFLPFLASSALLALVTLAARGIGLRRALRATLSPRVWLHPSARADYRLVAARALLRVATVGVRGLSTLAVAALVASHLRRDLGVSPVAAPAWLVGALFTVTAFVAEDAVRFALHRAMHRAPWLWEFHKVHHAAEVLTPLTLYRTHPAEAALHQSALALTVGALTGAFAATFGPELHAWHLLGVDALGALWTLAGANLRHSHVWLSYGPRVERFVLSPAQHQVHHSVDPRHVDRNFGTALALWDAWCGSLYVTSAREPLRFGLPPGERPIAHTVTAMLLDPVVALAARLVPPLRRAARVVPVALALLAASCTDAAPRLDRGELLRSFGRCTVERYTTFESAAGGLATATAAWADAPDDARRAAARTAWERAIDAWEPVDILRYGPATDFEQPGGRNLRAGIYAWPDVNRCLIEQQLVSRAYERPDFGELATSTRGLAAIEYLLFYPGDDNACAATEAINTGGAWAMLTADERTRRKAAYARAAAADVATRARALVAAWQPAGFADQLATAGRGSTLFATQQVAISAVAEGLFALDTDVKDLRLATALGLRACATGTCPAALESPYAGRGRTHLRNNLAGARMLLQGCAAGGNLGYDDLLASAGAPSLAASLLRDLAAAEAAVDALPAAPLVDTLARDPAALRRVHDAVKALTDALKMEFTMTLQIRSTRVEGDND